MENLFILANAVEEFSIDANYGRGKRAEAQAPPLNGGINNLKIRI